MKSTDLANATARALDLLPPGDPAGSDPRLLRDARMIEETRLTRETATDVWLAVSPLHVAPPDVLQAVLAEIDPARAVRSTIDHRLLKGLAVTGWAAAAAVLICLWPKADERPLPAVAQSPPASTDVPADKWVDAPTEAPAAIPRSRDSRLRTEIQRLQNRLASAQESGRTGAPRVIALHAPGTAGRSAEDARRRVQVILTNALRAALEAESGSSSDPASLVIERGWLAGALPAHVDGGFVRHRNFPEHSWRELGLLRSEDGSYYDSSSGLVWTPDPEGQGFVGRPTTAADDLTVFQTEEGGPSAIPIPKPRTAPEGFIVENSLDQNAEVIIDQVPPPAEGSGHVIVITDSAGSTTTIPVTPSLPPQPVDDFIAENSVEPDAGAIIDQAPSPAESSDQVTANTPATPPDLPTPEEEPLIAQNEQLGLDTISASAAQLGTLWSNLTVGSNSAGTLIFTIPSLNGLGSFQLLERPLVPNGQADRVIVEGGP